ncbi:hypothetical protein G7Y79_00036g072230 [Physcia stellaris]|nr:hypothetical protein G7Y79_00036g072230 [Physcia stellaris]
MFQTSSYLNLIAFLFIALSSFLGTNGTVPSPKASTDLICHTNNAVECYPSTFQPTEEFQIIKDDQALPPGLHVRMNLATGVKEARLNVPEPENSYSDLVIVETPGPDEEIENNVMDLDADTSVDDLKIPNHHDQSIFSKSPRIRDPVFEPGEAYEFESSMSQLRNPPDEGHDFNPALIALQDLCHSGDWGLKLTKDSNVTRLLVKVFQDVSQHLSVRSGAALLLATAIQNNPDALAAALSHFYNDEWPTGPLDAVLLALVHEQSAKLLVRAVFLLSSLSQDQDQLARFVNAGGIEALLQVFEAANGLGPEEDKLRGKIANFILDHIVDLDLAALSAETTHVDGMETGSNVPNPEAADDSWVLVEQTQRLTDPESVEKSLRDFDVAFDKSLRDLSKRSTRESMTAEQSVEIAKRALGDRLASKSQYEL